MVSAEAKVSRALQPSKEKGSSLQGLGFKPEIIDLSKSDETDNESFETSSWDSDVDTCDFFESLVLGYPTRGISDCLKA